MTPFTRLHRFAAPIGRCRGDGRGVQRSPCGCSTPARRGRSRLAHSRLPDGHADRRSRPLAPDRLTTACRSTSPRRRCSNSTSASRWSTRESLTQAVRAVATVVPDESRISHVHTRVSGWVEQLDVNTTGEMVRAGQPLARIFSQELFSSQTEYLAIRKTTSASGITSVVVAGGRTRLTVLGMTPADIDAIEQTGEPKRLFTVVAPRSGVVVNRGVTVGTSVDPSTTLLTIADLSRVWILAEVPEANIPAVRVGTLAQLEFPGLGPRAVFGAYRLRLPDAHRTHAHAARPLLGRRIPAARSDRGSTAPSPSNRPEPR